MNDIKNRKNSAFGALFWFAMLLLLCEVPVERAAATPDLRFDVVTFCCNCTSPSTGQFTTTGPRPDWVIFHVFGGQYTVSNGPSAGTEYFRLQQP